jgi:hypothetical protein
VFAGSRRIDAGAGAHSRVWPASTTFRGMTSVHRCRDRRHSPKRSEREGAQPCERGDDADALEQSREVDQTGGLAEPRARKNHGRQRTDTRPSAVAREGMLTRAPGPPSSGKGGAGKAEKHRQRRQIVSDPGPGGLGESIRVPGG